MEKRLLSRDHIPKGEIYSRDVMWISSSPWVPKVEGHSRIGIYIHLFEGKCHRNQLPQVLFLGIFMYKTDQTDWSCLEINAQSPTKLEQPIALSTAFASVKTKDNFNGCSCQTCSYSASPTASIKMLWCKQVQLPVIPQDGSSNHWFSPQIHADPPWFYPKLQGLRPGIVKLG